MNPNEFLLQYHEGIDATRYCALSRVNRWAYLLADNFCEPLGVTLVRGRHVPNNAAVPDSLLSIKSGSEDEMSVSKTKYPIEFHFLKCLFYYNFCS